MTAAQGGTGSSDEEEDRPPIVIDSADTSNTASATTSSTKTPRLLVHELAHICGLWQPSDTRNLAHPSGPGIRLTRRQQAIVRNSRFVTYL